jgi:hypothetical protein
MWYDNFAKIGKEDISELTVGNEISNDIHEFTWTSPDEKTHILIDRQGHSSVVDVRLFRAANSLSLSGGGKS